MLRGGIALATLAIAACRDAPARPAPRPTAPAQAARALLTQAMAAAVTDAERARDLVPPPPSIDDALRYADLLTFDPDDPGAGGGALGLRGTGPDDDPDNDPDDLGSVVGGIAPPTPADITVQLVSSDGGLDPRSVVVHTGRVRVRAELCRRDAIRSGTLDDSITAQVSLAATGSHSLAIHVSGAGPLTGCFRSMASYTDLSAGASLTFQVTIPGP